MDYGFGKTYTIPSKFTALNGCVQYYTLTANVELATEYSKKEIEENKNEEAVKAAQAQANLLRVLETLRTYGGQPVITRVEAGEKGKVHFTLEQANVYGNGGLHDVIHGKQQVSVKTHLKEDGSYDENETEGLINVAKAKIKELFANVKAVKLAQDAEGHIYEVEPDTNLVDVASDCIDIKEAF